MKHLSRALERGRHVDGSRWMRAYSGEIPVVGLRGDGIEAPVDYATALANACRSPPLDAVPGRRADQERRNPLCLVQASACAGLLHNAIAELASPQTSVVGRATALVLPHSIRSCGRSVWLRQIPR